MAALKMIGNLLDGTGWANAIVQADLLPRELRIVSYMYHMWQRQGEPIRSWLPCSIFFKDRFLKERERERERETNVDDVPGSEESCTEKCEQKGKAHLCFDFGAQYLIYS